jgi:hypothetical protein
MSLVDDVESELRATGAALVAVHDDECLSCYLERMLAAHGCDGTLRFALTWAAVRRLPLRGFRRRLTGNGGYCDCEAIMNAVDAGWEGRPAPGGGQPADGLRCVRSRPPTVADRDEM